MPHWLHPHGHFEGYEVPTKLLKSCEEFAANGFRADYVLVVDEKHSTWYYDASTTENLGQACIKLLTERKDQGYYFIPDKPREPEHNPGQFAKGTSLHDAAKADYSAYQNQLRYYKEAVDFDRRLQHVIDNCMYFSACRMLEERSGYEYERVNLEWMTVVNEYRKKERETQSQA